MKFKTISDKVSAKQASVAIEKFSWLTTELGVRETNEHVGTGMGGNNFQLVVLMGMEHKLSSSSKKNIEPEKDRVVWGVDWLCSASRREIRNKLNEVFPSILESKKYMALALADLSSLHDLRAMPTTS